MVLDGKFNEILKFSERVFRIALKPKRNKNNLISFSQKLFQLYALKFWQRRLKYEFQT